MATVKVSMLAETRQMRAGIDEMNKRLGGFGKTAGRLGGALAGAFAGVAVTSAFKDIVGAASNAQQSLGATETVFGKFSKSVISDSKAAANQFGLDANTYRENANLLGAIFSNQGVAASKLAGATKEMVGVGADLAATFGGTTTDAVGALSAAFKGEFDSLDKYGISLNATKIAAELAARGQDKLTGAALDAAKQQVTADLIMKQSAKTRGAFAKESNTLAGQQQRLAAKFENIKAAIGMKLLPVLTKMTAFVSEKVLPALGNWAKVFDSDVRPALEKVGTFLKSNLLPPLKALGEFMAKNKTVVATFVGVIVTVVAVTKAWAIAQGALNLVMALNPMGLLVIALAGLAAALVYAYQKSETFRNIVNSAFSAVRTVIKAVMPVLRAIIKGAWVYISTVTRIYWKLFKTLIVTPVKFIVRFVRSPIATIKQLFSAAWNFIKTKTADAFNAIYTKIKTKITEILRKVGGLKQDILGKLKDAGSWLKETGKNLIEGLWDGIKSLGDWLKDNIIDLVKDKLPKAVRKVLGINSPSRVFKEIGIFTVQGLAEGLGDRSALSKVTKASKGMTGAIDIGINRPSYSGASVSRGGNVYHITVEVAPGANLVEAGRQMTAAIDAYERAGGRRSA